MTVDDGPVMFLDLAAFPKLAQRERGFISFGQ